MDQIKTFLILKRLIKYFLVSLLFFRLFSFGLSWYCSELLASLQLTHNHTHTHTYMHFGLNKTLASFHFDSKQHNNKQKQTKQLSMASLWNASDLRYR